MQIILTPGSIYGTWRNFIIKVTKEAYPHCKLRVLSPLCTSTNQMDKKPGACDGDSMVANMTDTFFSS